MHKKLAVIGKGTAGAISAAHFYRHTNWEIDWYYDPNTPTQAVGEGANLLMPIHLWEYFNFSHNDIHKLDGSFKTGIYKEGWGKTGKEFYHNFTPPALSYHFNALKMQEYIFNKIKNNKRVNIIEKNIHHDEIDADFILDCSGKPKSSEELLTPEYIPVNSVYVTQCFWEDIRFQYTLTIAKKHGWVFGIPLKNRCSIGYLYNNNISTIEEIKDDVKEIFLRFNLTPSDTTNAFTFGNYYRKENFKNRIVYNGNASFFLEPLEATSFSTIIQINKIAWDLWNDNYTAQTANHKFKNIINEVQIMIMLHYYSSSKYKSKFWEFASENGKKCIVNSLSGNKLFRKHIEMTLYKIDEQNEEVYSLEKENRIEGFGTWADHSFFENVKGLDIYQRLRDDLINFVY